MKPIVEYKDYRQFIQDYYDDRKQKAAFTWRDFAAQAGFASPVFLKYVCEGKKNLGAVAVERVAIAMGLTGFEVPYFRALVSFAHAKNDSDKKEAVDTMQDIAAANNVKILNTDEFAYFDSWKNPVIRELAAAMPGAKPLDIAHASKVKISASEVSETLQFLVKAGMLKKDENGNYTQTDKVLSSGDKDFVPLAVRNMHRQMGSIALEALESPNISERQFTGITMGISENTYARILKELADCRHRIASLAAEEQQIERVYRVNMQVFPLSEKIK